MTAEEYAKVSAVSARIVGLRRSMTATAFVGIATSWFVFLAVSSFEVLTLDAAAFWLGLASSIAAFAPFVGIIGYLSSRVNKHIDRLSRGKYGAPMITE